ncbi:hypothetical protein M081_1384 [Bacteroides fragilis str. 3998 T(B) 4]|nr:hypothetical protein M081_1384 [Bacteroides fragilis str. 3998 T(B) 4]
MIIQTVLHKKVRAKREINIPTIIQTLILLWIYKQQNKSG